MMAGSKSRHLARDMSVPTPTSNPTTTPPILPQPCLSTGCSSYPYQAETRNLSHVFDFHEDLAENAVIPITETDIRRLHALLLSGLNDEAGSYRSVRPSARIAPRDAVAVSLRSRFRVGGAFGVVYAPCYARGSPC